MRRLKAEPAQLKAAPLLIEVADTALASSAELESLSELSHTFVEVLPRAMWTLRSGIRQAAGENFTMPQFRVLTRLRKGSSTNGELAEAMGVSVPAMSRMVDGLVEMGFVVRVPQDHDRRQVKLELNADGRRKYRRLQKHIHSVFMERFARLSAERRQTLSSGLDVFVELFP